jgi:hypothetical protein
MFFPLFVLKKKGSDNPAFAGVSEPFSIRFQNIYDSAGLLAFGSLPVLQPSRADAVLPLDPVVGYSLKNQLLDYSDGIATDLHRVPGCRINYSHIGA